MGVRGIYLQLLDAWEIQSTHKMKNFLCDLKRLFDWNDYDVLRVTNGRNTIDFSDIVTWYKQEKKLSVYEAELLAEKFLGRLVEFKKIGFSYEGINNTSITNIPSSKQHPPSIIERAIDYQLSSWWPIVENALFFNIQAGNCKSASKNDRIILSLKTKKTLMKITKNKTEDILISFIDKSINKGDNDNFDKNQFEINKGLGILMDYWGGRGHSKMRQNMIAKKYCVSESYVSQVIKKAKKQLKNSLYKAFDKNLITVRQKNIFLLCYIDSLNHREIGNKLNISQSYVSRAIRIVKWKLGEILQKEVLKRYNSR